MKITDETVRKIAHLARLEVGPEELEGVKADMNRILDFMDKLAEIDTSGVEPLIYMTDETTVLRPDNAGTEIPPAEALRNAPDQDGKYFRVAKVIDKS